jgi:hypothetical protein
VLLLHACGRLLPNPARHLDDPARVAATLARVSHDPCRVLADRQPVPRDRERVLTDGAGDLAVQERELSVAAPRGTALVYIEAF